MKNKRKLLTIVLNIILIIFILNFNSFAFEIEEATDYIWLQEEITNASNSTSKEPNINSKYAIVLDRDSKTILYEKNTNKKLPMASTTKIMTAIVLLENIEKNNSLTLETQVEVCKEAGAIGGSRLGLKKGDKVITYTGLSGTIEEILEDRIILETRPDNVKLSIEKWAIAGLDDRTIDNE